MSRIAITIHKVKNNYVNSNGQTDDRHLRFFTLALQRKSSNVKSKLEALFFLENLISKYGSPTSTPKSAEARQVYSCENSDVIKPQRVERSISSCFRKTTSCVLR